MANLVKFNYENNAISFEFSDGNKMINATEMARPFGKLPGNFLKSQHAQDYIRLLEMRYAVGGLENGQPKEVLRVVKGGGTEPQGTWMDEKLALKFAAWLSPEFELWVYDRIQELLTTGKTEIREFQPSGVIQSLRLIVEKLEDQEVLNEKVRGELDQAAQRLDELEAKIVSVDENYYTIAGYCTLHKIPCPLDKAKEWGKAATALSHTKGIAMGTAHDERYGRVKTYHREVLEETIGK
ncbi:KilA-N domain-containing protein [Haliscomenobacter hydrossis]|uniref:KilA, /APSES-type HTH DNA-binding domain protein n=1 Tax=Haliscomenobacter hydrossis (strain ATCC 27775 / DSM 1100 / LMG 10767 / O) TaxID=760192 RepID=F4L816_HALH1|nr:KilA-N domain-containing protein [Haliscomenobacter hydrossis]AEE54524.1 KilA, /APSES-type HTH DNA-binding domain protein [Haliscomenobacter hydrossis DSM 1100]